MSARAAALPWASGLWTADQFLEFYMTRPDEERWQLVDGLAMMMPPPTLGTSESWQIWSDCLTMRLSNVGRISSLSAI